MLTEYFQSFCKTKIALMVLKAYIGSSDSQLVDHLNRDFQLSILVVLRNHDRSIFSHNRLCYS